MAQRPAPVVSGIDAVPVSGLPELLAHLQDLVADAARPLNAKLLDHVELQLTQDNIPPLLPALLPPLTHILKSTAQDPTPLVSLTTKLLTPLSFTQTLGIADSRSLSMALRSDLSGANLLALAILHKAAAAPSDAAILSTMPDVVDDLVRRWLESPDVGVGERAAKVLGDLLETDCESVDGQPVNGLDPAKRRLPGHGRLWSLISQSPTHLSLVQSLCTPGPAADAPSRPVPAITIAQGRLLRLLPRLATLNLGAVSQTPIPGLFPLPDAVSRQAGRGLLQWAALGMVAKSDVLMHLSLIDFFETLVSVMRLSARSPASDDAVRSLVSTAVQDDADLAAALRSLPDRTVEAEAEDLRQYIADMLD